MFFKAILILFFFIVTIVPSINNSLTLISEITSEDSFNQKEIGVDFDGDQIAELYNSYLKFLLHESFFNLDTFLHFQDTYSNNYLNDYSSVIPPPFILV